MSRIPQSVLALAGLAAFLAAWQAAVKWTEPPAIRRVTIAFSAPRGSHFVALILAADGRRAGVATLGLSERDHPATVEALRRWMSSLQPTLAALPTDDGAGSIGRRLAEAQTTYGGGLDIVRG